MAALVVVYGLLGEQVPWLSSAAVPVALQMEADVHVDDVVVSLDDGSRVFMQAKLDGRSDAVGDTVGQWCASIKAGECTQRDELLLMVATAPPNLQQLAEALNMRRRGASLTPDARSALDVLVQRAEKRGLDAVAVARLLDAAKVCIVDAREGGPQEATGAACLNAAVVKPGHGMAAFRALRAAAHALAAARAPSDAAVWQGWLREARLPLVADADGALAARMQAQEEAVAAYREELARGCDVLPLADLGLGLTSLDVPGLTGSLRVSALSGREDDGRHSGRDLLTDIMRRQGRLFLVGRPGSGKTVASRLIAAQWARTAHAPVPVWLRLKDLAPLLPAVGPYRVQVADVVRAAVGPNQPSLAAGLARRIEHGEALLILDALDEVLQRRDAVVEAVTHLIGHLPPGLDVLVTSRHSSARAADALHLPTSELIDPHRLTDTLDHLLLTTANRFAGGEDKDTWIADRRQRVKQSQAAEPDLWRVPLMATLMVLLIAQHPLASVPTSRAGLLAEVIETTVRQWETGRAGLALPDTNSAPDAVLDCYADIAHLVAVGTGEWDDAIAAVSDRLQHHWGMPAGHARASARSIVEYWDATAGIFITSTPQGTLQARTRLFAEIGEARWAVREPADLPQWMDEALADEDRWESARLAAGLSPTAARVLIERALHQRGSLLDLIHDALTDGAVFDDTALHAVRQAQLERLEDMPDQEPRTTESGPGFLRLFSAPPRARLAVLLADDDLDTDQTTRLLAASTRMGSQQAAVIAALCAQRQARQRSTAMTNTELDTLQAALLPQATDGPPHGQLAGTDRLVRAAVKNLLPARPGTALDVIPTVWKSSLTTLEWFEEEMSQLGRDDVIRSLHEGRSPSLAAVLRSLGSWKPPFRLLSLLSNAPANLTAGQAWHLDEAAAFIQALELAETEAMEPTRAVEDHEDLTRELCRTALAASGLDPAVVTTQMRALHDENADRPDWGLLYQASTRTPQTQLIPETISTDLLLETLRTGNQWLTDVALTMALHAHELPAALPGQLLAALPGLPAEGRRMTAILLTLRWPDVPVPDDDPATRAGLARATAVRLADTHLHHDAHPLLADIDLLVRQEAATGLQSIPEDTRPGLERALATPASQWTCLHCDTRMTIEKETCAKRHARPRPRLP
ncbi:NACHT domain-containing protein [Streptomyces sp. NPDC087270]|uniref:NACHT domain-containing protein n=1 Tax=Streptomyces sp. NPDC087270 TaxID=3365774 RepID=UPI003817258B